MDSCKQQLLAVFNDPALRRRVGSYLRPAPALPAPAAPALPAPAAPDEETIESLLCAPLYANLKLFQWGHDDLRTLTPDDVELITNFLYSRMDRNGDLCLFRNLDLQEMFLDLCLRLRCQCCAGCSRNKPSITLAGRQILFLRGGPEGEGGCSSCGRCGRSCGCGPDTWTMWRLIRYRAMLRGAVAPESDPM